MGRPAGQRAVSRSPRVCVPVKVMTPRAAPGTLPLPGIQAWGRGPRGLRSLGRVAAGGAPGPRNPEAPWGLG